ncbi:hypothetical protein ACF06W_00990 [Streptomyces albus]
MAGRRQRPRRAVEEFLDEERHRLRALSPGEAVEEIYVADLLVAARA